MERPNHANAEKPKCCCLSGCCAGIERRDFLKLAALGAAGTAAGLTTKRPVMAGPFEASDFEKLLPIDKKLDPAWVKSLFERGKKTVYRGAELEKIGMPVGGLCSGQLYLGGDGKLWHWDIFNQIQHTGDAHYANPPKPDFPLEQGFGICVSAGGKTEFRKLDHTGFSDIAFRGEYPIGLVEYLDPALPVAVSLEAFSPFVPLNTADSSLPTTVMRFTVKNIGRDKIEADMVGWLQNAVCLFSEKNVRGRRVNKIVRRPGVLLLDCGAVPAPKPAHVPKPRSDVVFEDFQKETYAGWAVEGKAFGDGPILKSAIPQYQGDVGSRGPRVVNSHASAPGDNVGAKDSQTGSLTSREFVIERNYIALSIGGGNHPGKTCVNLLVDGKVAQSLTGHNDNRMRRDAFDASKLQGKLARLQIVDHESGPWGNIGVAEIVFTDRRPEPSAKPEAQPDFGTMSLGLLEAGLLASDAADIARADADLDKLSEAIAPTSDKPAPPSTVEADLPQRPVGLLGRRLLLDAGQEETATFVVAWNFPNLQLKNGGRYYTNRFATSADAAEYVAKNFDSLAKQTRLWRDTWYDSTLPYWFLDRTMANTSTLATSTCHRFADGRFYAWEGVGCCEGTCTHVWHYAHAVGRLFPELERDLRVRTDFGTALDPKTGVIQHRGESAGLAVDGQAGCILRAYREHQMSPNSDFLKPLWPKIKLAMNCLVRMDLGDGLLNGAQHNTLDAAWFGKIAWLSSLYVCAARACEQMAAEMGDADYAANMRKIVETGSKTIDRELFNGEYYYQIADPAHKNVVGSYDGCEIDQAMGQSWAWQVGLGRILNEKNVKRALQSLWRYNFTPDVGPYRNVHKPGRWYAMPGEAGLLICTWPRGESPLGDKAFWSAMYFNECMNGFEYQAAGHMIWEGMVQEGLAIVRAIHDRYHASRRNPWNEVECGDHYARSMASYGVFLAVCGYCYHGPQGFLAFSPRLTPKNFRAAFTTAEGWGTFSQTRQNGRQRETIELKHGRLRLRGLVFDVAEGVRPKTVRVALDGRSIAARHHREGATVVIELAADATLEAGENMEIQIQQQ